MAVEFTLRRLAKEDLETVAVFEREIAEISFPEDPVTELDHYLRKLSNALVDRRSWPLVADIAGELAGWVWIAKRENHVTGELYADLRSFYIAAPYRGTGPAFALMRAVVAFCQERSLTRIVGRTAASNEAMQAVYEVFGFDAKHIVYELSVAPAPLSVSQAGRGRKPFRRKKGNRRA